MIMFELPWPPTVNTYYRSVGGRNILSEKGRQYKATTAKELLVKGVTRHGSARISVLIDAYPPDRRKRDLDNITKPILDCLEEYGVFDNDEQVDVLTVRRRERGGFVIIHVSEIPAEESLY